MRPNLTGELPFVSGAFRTFSESEAIGQLTNIQFFGVRQDSSWGICDGGAFDFWIDDLRLS